MYILANYCNISLSRLLFCVSDPIVMWSNIRVPILYTYVLYVFMGQVRMLKKPHCINNYVIMHSYLIAVHVYVATNYCLSLLRYLFHVMNNAQWIQKIVSYHVTVCCVYTYVCT